MVNRLLHKSFLIAAVSGVAKPLAARGGGEICRPFILGFGNWRAGRSQRTNVSSPGY